MSPPKMFKGVGESGRTHVQLADTFEVRIVRLDDHVDELENAELVLQNRRPPRVGSKGEGGR